MSSHEAKTNIEEEAALKKYRKGMNDLGRGLIALAVLQLIVGGGVGVAILVTRFEPLLLVIVGGMGTVHLLMGLLILRNHGWANYLVAVWSALLLVANFAVMSMQGRAGERGSNPGGCIGLLIAVALFYYSVKNLWRLRKVRAKGLEP